MSAGQLPPYVPDRAAAVTLSDSAANVYSMLYVGVTGDVKVTTAGGDAVTFTAVPAGQYIFVRTAIVWNTGTTATNIVGIF